MKISLAIIRTQFTLPKIIFIFLCLAYLIVASLQSLARHYQFLTNTWDLGFYNQLMYKFAHFKFPVTTFYRDAQYQALGFLGDHVTLLMPFHSQLYWIFGSYTLLIVQILYGLVGAFGLYKLICFRFESANLALAGVFLFFTHYSLYAALDFDVHDNVYGIMLLPWILYFYYKENFKWFLISLGIFLLAREDLAITAMMLGLCFLIFDWKTKRRYGLACLTISGVYFLFAYKIIIPCFSPLPEGAYVVWPFKYLGNSISEVLRNTIINPGRIISLMFNTIEKQEKLKYFLYTGGVLFIFRPKYFLIVVPTFFITCLSSDWVFWGNMYHYNIIFAIILPYLIISTTTLLRLRIFKISLVVIAIWFNLHYLDKNFFIGWGTFNRIFTYDYYHQRNNLREIREGLNLIPRDAAVSANNYYTPHLAFRNKVYFFPDIKDAEYIAINAADRIARFYPFESSDKFSEAVKQLRDNPEFEILYEKNEMLVFKRRNK